MDLVVGMLIMLLLSATMFMIGRHLAQRHSHAFSLAISASAVIHLGLFLWLLWDNLLLAKLFPGSNLIVVGNVQPVLVGLLAGLASGVATVPAYRRVLLVTAIVGISLWKAYAPLFRAVPATAGDHWSEGVCLQSTGSTCSPAAAATLLLAHGIHATEAEMARLCLTSDRGSSAHGLYRGLVLKTHETPWRVQVFGGPSALLQQQGGTPAIITVGLRQGQSDRVDPRYAHAWGWQEGVKHTVVLYGFEADGRAIIGDPAVGREHWTAEAIDVLWYGQGLRLVPREQ